MKFEKNRKGDSRWTSTGLGDAEILGFCLDWTGAQQAASPETRLSLNILFMRSQEFFYTVEKRETASAFETGTHSPDFKRGRMRSAVPSGWGLDSVCWYEYAPENQTYLLGYTRNLKIKTLFKKNGQKTQKCAVSIHPGRLKKGRNPLKNCIRTRKNSHSSQNILFFLLPFSRSVIEYAHK